MERIWFADVNTPEEMQLALSLMRGYLEEILLANHSAKVEIHCNKWTPTSFFSEVDIARLSGEPS